MTKESLLLAKEIIITGLDKNGQKIPVQDRAELMILLYNLLTPETYEDDVKALKNAEYKRRQNRGR
jgi:hypothetical protein